MIKMTKLTILLLLTQISFMEISLLHAEDSQEESSYPYPLFYDGADSFSDEDTDRRKSKADSSKAESPSAWHGKVGNATVTIDVENTDFISQCQAEWERREKKNASEKKKRSHFSNDENDEKEDKKEDHSPKARILIEWGKN
jgi:hypothetical protein